MRRLLLSLVVLVCLAVSATAGVSGTAYASTQDCKTITKIVEHDPNFSTLASLLKKAGLAGALKDGGTYTVFAPTNAAFAKVPASTLQALQNDPAALKRVLEYHVVSGKVMSCDLASSGTLTTLNGLCLPYCVCDGTVRVDSATVMQADIVASNGVIHVIDSVMIPPKS